MKKTMKTDEGTGMYIVSASRGGGWPVALTPHADHFGDGKVVTDRLASRVMLSRDEARRLGKALIRAAKAV